MASTQFGHISELFETLLTVLLFILTGIEIISFIFNSHQKLNKQLITNHKQQLEWSKQKVQFTQSQHKQNKQIQQQFDLQKSVADYVKNQITNMQQVQSQQKQPSTINKQDQQKLQNNTPNKIKFYRIYIAFNHFINQKMAILIPILILGILTQSTYVYSLAAFFFAFLCQLLIEVLTVEEQVNKIKTNGFGLRQLLKIIQNLFIMSIFISYWAVKQYDAS